METKEKDSSTKPKRKRRTTSANKKTSTSKASNNKLTEEAKRKVDELLDGIKVTKKDKEELEDRVVKIQTEKDKSLEWYEEQLNALSLENDELRAKIHNLESSQQNHNNNDLINKINIFFRETENLYTGRNPRGTKFYNIETKDVLNRILYYFKDHIKK